MLAAVIDNNISVGTELQNYRLAIAATAEYTALLGGQAQAFAAIESFVDDANEIFERELAIHFDLVSGTNTVFTDSATDGYTNGAVATMINENTPRLNTVLGGGDSVLGASLYDIGHVFGTATSGGQGRAGLGVVGGSNKGRGASISSNPQGPDWVKLVVHEFGHQFNAEHTFNANAFGSAAGNREAGSAYEPASGTTLMSYAGISGADDLQNDPDDYFHAASFEAIQTFVSSTAPPNTTTTIGNAVPSVSGGSDYVIPAQTPFELTAVGTDTDSGDVLTYTWEQLDLGAAMSLPIFDNGSSPLFRSYPPSQESSRVFPNLPDLINNVNTASLGETLPTTNRSLNFRTTVRDGVGGVHSDDVLLTVVDTGTPFAVTSPNTSVNWAAGTSQSIAWNVGGTDANGINVSNVAFDLSLDGGFTYPINLVSSTPNDGSHLINAPNFDATEARLRVRPIGNVFFDISDANFSISSNASVPGVGVVETNGQTVVGEDGVGGNVVDSYDLSLNTSPSGTVQITVSADAETEVSLDGTNFSSTVAISFSDTTPTTIFVRGLDDGDLEGVHTGLITHTVTASSSPDYPTDLSILPIVATIADDESPPLVGVDFESPSTPNSAPTNWSLVTDTFGSTTNDLVNEVGLTTDIDLTISVSGGANVADSSPPPNLPNHTPSLADLDGIRLAANSFTLTWSGLIPGQEYDVWAFLSNPFSNTVAQNVTITGDQVLPPFLMDGNIGSTFLVNDAVADSSRTLSDDAKRVAANASGQITVDVVKVAGNDYAMLSGAAIRAVATSQTIDADLSVSADGNEQGPTDIVFTVTLNQTNSTGVPITFDIDDLGTGSATSGSDYIAIASNAQISVPNGQSTGSLTVQVINDSVVENTETVVAQISNPSDPSVTLGTVSATAQITDNEPLPTLTLTINPNSISENGGSATGTVTRSNGTSGDLTVSLLSNDTTEATVPTTVIIPNGSTTAMFTVTAVDDAVSDGTQTVTVTASATLYESDTSNIDITDDDVATLGPLVGIDFDSGTTSPTNWTRFVQLRDANAIDLIAEDGSTTTIDLTSTADLGFAGGASGPSSMVPSHTQPLDGIGGYASTTNSTQPYVGTFGDLIPGAQYRVYMFVYEPLTADFVHDITYAGANTVSFTQTVPNQTLMVNRTAGSSSNALESYAELVTADSNGEIQITVAPGAGSAGVAISALAIQQSGPTPDSLTVAIDAAEISENGGSSTATVTRSGPTNGALTVTLSSDDTTEATVPASVVIPDGSASVSFDVSAANDSDLDGTQTVTITASAATFVDGSDTIDVTDDEVATTGPLVGVDFDPSLISPFNWTGINTLSGAGTINRTNLIAEDGSFPGINLNVSSASINFFGATPNASTIPTHSQSLAGLDGQIYTQQNPISVTWSGLNVESSYEVYVFGLESFYATIFQNINIAGDGPALNIDQVFGTNQLGVNDSVGSSASNLQSYAQVLKPASDGTIVIDIARFNNSQDVSLGGLAIRELFLDSTINANLSVTTNGDESGPVDIVYTVTLDAPNDTGSAITFDLDDLGTGTATSGLDYVAIPTNAQISVADGASSGTFTVTVNDDGTEEPTETLIASISNPSAANVSIATATASAEIADNDGAPTLTVVVNSASISEAAGAAATSATITRTGDLTGPLDVTLFSSDPSEVAVVMSVTIPAGQPSVTVDLDAVDDTAADGDQTAVITAYATDGVSYGTTGLDGLFGSAGLATTQLNEEGGFIQENIAIQDDGKIVAVSQGFNPSQIIVTRLNPDGSEDTGFGSNGIVFLTIGSDAESQGIAIDDSGKILISGKAGFSAIDPFLLRLNSDGTLDGTYGNSGLVDFGGLTNIGLRDIALTHDGKVLAAVEGSGAFEMRVIRVDSDGSLDASFGQGGLKTYREFDAESAAIEVLPDGRFLVLGNGRRATIIRSFPDGTLDTTFGNSGSQRFKFTESQGPTTSLAVHHDGRIAIGGAASDPTTRSDFAVAVLTSDGQFDSSFSGDGIALLDLNPSDNDEDDSVESIQFQADGKILAIGQSDRFVLPNEIAIARFNTDGTPDTTFDGDGVLLYSHGGGSQQLVSGSEIDSDGRLLVLAGGSTSTKIARINLGVRNLQGSDSILVTDNDAAATLDFGDAPTAVQSGFAASYPVTLAENGARHDRSTGGPILGNLAEAELNGAGSAHATFDDTNGSDDEDGVNFFGPIIASSAGNSTASIEVTLSNADPTSNRLDAWIDFNRDGDWSDAGEQIFTSFDLGTVDGTQTLSFSIPQDTGTNVVNGDSFARFRVSTSGGLGVTGSTLGGEVEDHRVAIVTADPFVVDTLDDNIDGDYSAGQLSLREAIDLANARPEADEIQFASTLPAGTIPLSIGQLTITEAVDVIGPGASSLTVSGSTAFRVFDVKATSTVRIDGMTISDGQTFEAGQGGAAIRSVGPLEITNSVIANSQTSGGAADGGGISLFGGSLSLTDSTVSNNSTTGFNSFGGGIYSNGAPVNIIRSLIDGNSTNSSSGQGVGGGVLVLSADTTVTDSTISNNENLGAGSVGGGLVVSSGNLTVDSSTISGNTTPINGGGILFGSTTHTATVTNSTISGNTATLGNGGGISVFQGTFELVSSTVTSNTAPAGFGSGVASSSDGTAVSNTIITSSIVAGNTNSDIDNIISGSGGATISSGGFNVIGTGSATTAFSGSDEKEVTDPGLSALANNGGPTETHALLVGSPAIDRGPSTSSLAFDQRGPGFSRVVNGNLDSGAFELQTTIPSVTLTVDNTNIAEAVGVATFTATLSETSASDVTVELAFSGTATLTDDYTRSGTQIVIPAGNLSGSVTVTAVQDTVDDDAETITVDIASVTGGTENGTQQQTTTIDDDDDPFETLVEIDASNNLLVRDVAGGVTDDNITIRVDGTNIRVSDSGAILLAGNGGIQVDPNTVDIPISSITGTEGIIVDTLGGQDTLTLNFDGGNFASPIVFSGGEQTTTPGDSLVLTGGGIFTDAIYNYDSENDGSIDLTGNATITYTGLEPITATISAVNVTLNFSDAAEVITIGDAGGGQTSVDSDVAGEVTVFNHPSGTLTINPGDTGDNTVIVNSMGTLAPVDHVFGSGSGSDTVNFEGSLITSGGDVLVDADTINVNANIATQAGDLTLAASGDINVDAVLSTTSGLLTITADSDGNGAGEFKLLPATLGGFNEAQKLLASDGANSDRFGASVAISGDYAVVGASQDDDDGDGSGSAYVYFYNGSQWVEQQKLTAADAAAGDRFGINVAIDGDTIVIGALNHDAGGVDAGAAYVFTNVAGTWTQQQKLLASDADAGDRFGVKVDVSGDSILVGANQEGDTIIRAGAAYVFTRSGSTWSEQQKLVASDAASNHFFGNSIAIEGDLAVVAAPSATPGGIRGGAAYVFERSGSTWTEQQILAMPNAADADNFGRVAISGDTIAVGAPGDDDDGTSSGSVIVFTNNGGTWTQQQKIVPADGEAGKFFGEIVRIDGNTLVVGADYDEFIASGLGAAYVFTRSGSVWTQANKLFGADTTTTDDFSTGVAIDSNRIIAGAVLDADNGSDSGSAYFFLGAPITSGGEIQTDSGAVIISAATVDLQGSVFGNNTLELRPSLSTSTIGLGGGTGTFNLDDTELSQISTAFLSVQIGDPVAGTGDINVNTVSIANSVVLSGGLMKDAGGVDLDVAEVTLDADVSPGQSPGVLTIAGNLTFADNETYQVEIGGTTPGTANSNHDQVDVTGLVTIGSNVTLATSAFGSYAVSVGDSFTIIENDGIDAVTGTFLGLPEGTSIPNFLGSNLSASITYVGGTGNDVVINVQSSVPTLSISATDASKAEGDAGTTAFTFTVSRINDTNGTTTVDYAVTGSGTNPADVADFGGAFPSGTVSFADGETTKVVTIDVSGDIFSEADDTFSVTLSNPSAPATIETSSATGTITDDDLSEISIAVDPSSILEDAAGVLTYTFTRDKTSAETPPLTVDFSTSGTASATDYTASSSGTVTFAAGASTATVTVDPTADTIVEPDETVVLTIETGAGYDVAAASTATGTIANDDISEISIAVDPTSILEDAAGVLTYTFTRDNTSAETPALTVNFDTSGTASATDYTASGTDAVTFAAGANTATITVDPTADPTVEPDETIILTINDNAGYTVGSPGSATGTIANDDAISVITIDVAPTSVSEDGANNLIYTLSRTGDTSVELIVNVNFSGTASGTDYSTSTTSTVTFASGSSEATVEVNPLSDQVVESDETVVLSVVGGIGYAVGAADMATGTIANDDVSSVSVSVDPAEILEDTVGTLTYTFTRNNTSPETPSLTINVGIAGSATAGTDYAPSPVTVTFPAGQSTATVEIDPVSDADVEPDESVILSVDPGTGYGVGSPSSATGIITDDDVGEVSIAVDPTSILEDAAGVLTYTFTRDNTSAETPALTVNFSTGGTASATDYTASDSGSVTFAAGASTATVTVDPTADTIVEPDETVVLTIETGAGYDVAAASTATGTITNDDISEVSIAVDPASILEDAAGILTYTFTRDNTSAETPALTVNFSTSGSASATDYNASDSGTVTFAAGASTATVTVDPTADTIVEPDETVVLTVDTGPGYDVAAASTATGTITNDDISEVSIAVDPTSILEDAAGVLTYTFTRDNTSAETPALTVNFGTSGTATATDYTASDSGSVTFAAGASTATVTVDPTAGTIVEPDETVVLTIETGAGYDVAAASTATGTIANDDVSEVSIAVDPASILEDAAGVLTYTFTRDNTSAETPALSVSFTTSGTATTAVDYTASAASQITFEAGATTAIITVDPNADTTVEPDESVVLTLTPASNYVVAASDSATGTITNDDDVSIVTVAISQPSVTEDGVENLVYTLTRTGDTGVALPVSFSLSGSASATDYAASDSGTVTFAIGSDTATVTVAPIADSVVEPDETVILTVDTGTGYSVGAANNATGTISNDDQSEVSITVDPTSILEDAAGVLAYTFTRDNTSAETPELTVNFSTSGSASASDYNASDSGTVTFAAGASTATVTVDPTADTIVEPDETVVLTVDSGAGYDVAAASTATGTITNDDISEVSIAVDPASILEDAAGVLTYTFTRDNTSAETPALTVNFGTSGTATATDYNASDSGTVTFAAGASTATVTVDPTADTIIEPDETVVLTVDTGAGYDVAAANAATGTITNDDVSEVSITVDPTSILEDAAGVLTYTFTRDNTSAETPALTINFSSSGTASASDYTASGTDAVTFATGASTATVTVDPTTDSIVEPDETVVLTVDSGAGYNVAAANTATGTITNDDVSEVSIAVDPSSILEDAAGVLTYTFTRDNTSAETPALTVNFGTSGTATATDYNASDSGAVTFAAGASTATVTVDPTADTIVEPDETVVLTVDTGAGYDVAAASTATGTITNDDVSEVSIAVDPASILEDAAGVLTYTFTRDNTSAETPALTINFSASGTASASDYTASGTGAVTFATGASTATVTVDPTTDSIVEPDETVVLTVDSGAGYNVAAANTATGTITNDDVSEISIAVAPASIAEDAAGVLTYTFTRDNTSAETPALTVNFSTTGTASATDYSASQSGTVTFAAGASTATVTVDPTADSIVEPDENVVLTVDTGAGYNVAAANAATGTITNDDVSEVSIAVDPTSILEDAAGVLTYTFTRDNTSAETPALTVSFTTSGTATAAVDYSASAANEITFAAGTSTANVTVDPNADTTVEPDETVVLTLLSSSNYVVAAADTATGTITNDDDVSIVTVALSSTNVTEDGAENLIYTLTRTGDTGVALPVSFSLSGTASATDYAASENSLVTFPIGSNTTIVTVNPTTDPIVEPDETVVLTVDTGAGYSVGTANTATGTITNDDVSEISIAVDPDSILEDTAGVLTYTFSRTNTSAESPALTINFNTNGTASANDFTASQSGTVTFAAGASTATVTVDPTADSIVEPDESVVLTVETGAGYDVAAANTATGTITNDDVSEVSIAVDPASILEDAAGVLTYTFTRDNTSAETPALTVNFSTGGSASATDYTASDSGTVNFAAGASTATVTVDPTADSIVEPDETVVLTVETGAGYDVAAANTATGTITNDDVSEVSIAVDPASILEDAAGVLTYTFTRDNTSAETPALTVNFSTGGTATATDYTASDSGTVTFAAGASTATVTVDPTADSIVEPDESVVLTVETGAGYDVAAANTATGTITNDDVSEVSIAVDPASILEDAAGVLTYTFTRDNTSAETPALTVNFSTGGSASATDYTASDSGTVTFAAGASTATVTVDPTADSIVEPDETVVLTVDTGAGYDVAAANTATGTITSDNVSEVSIAVDPTSILEDAAGVLTYTFTRDNTSAETPALTVNFSTGGTAAATDYSASDSGTVTFAAGASTATVTVDPTADLIVEPDETVVLTVETGAGYDVAAANTATGTITNDDDVTLVTIQVDPTSVLEDGSENLIYTLTRTGDTSSELAVNFTADGTATPGNDYAMFATATVTFAAGFATTLVVVNPTADSIVEADETVILTLAEGEGYAIGSANSASATISNDDSSSVSIAVAPGAVTEDSADVLTYTFTRDNTSAETPALTVNFGTSGTASANDYTASSAGTVTFAAGASTATVTVDPTADLVVEPDETVVLTVDTGAGYNVAAANTATGTITNDDVSEVSIAVDPASILEDAAGVLTYTFTRDNTSAETPALTVNFSTGGTATVTDYTASDSGTVTFAAGASTATVTVDPTADSIVEPDETVVLTVDAGAGYNVAAANTATGTITNDDLSEVSIAVDPASIAEDATGVLTYTFTRNNTSPESPALTVAFATAGTATADDYVASDSGTVTFATGANTATVTIDPLTDTAFESDETVVLTLTDGAGYDLAAPISAVGTITNDDAAPVVSLTVESTIPEDGAENIEYTFARAGDTSTDLVVNFATTGTATPGSDYSVTATGSVTILAGESSVSVIVDPTADAIVEPDETVILQVLPGVGYDVGTVNSAVGTIANDDVSNIQVTVDPSTILENAPGVVTFTLSRDNVSSETPALNVDFQFDGTATSDIDFTASVFDQVSFAPGAETTTVTIDPIADTEFESDKTVVLTILPGSSYVIGAAGDATATILDDDFDGTTPQVESIIYFNQDAETEKEFTPDGTGQRSIIRRIQVTFTGPVTVPLGAVTDGSFIVESTSGKKPGTEADLEVVSSDLINGKQVVVLKLAGKKLIEDVSRQKKSINAMLVDGTYKLSIDGAKLNIDANGSALGVKAVDEFHRLFGDGDGDRDVDGDDYSAFLAHYSDGENNALFDFDDRPNKKTRDRVEFLKRLGDSL